MEAERPCYTVGVLAELCGLSRSALLYYDAEGLLSPSARSAAGYRLYSEADRRRLERIVAYRSLGISLERIKRYLDAPTDGPVGMLLRRVFEINAQIEELRRQQRVLLDLVEEDGSLAGAKDRLHALEGLGREAGLDQTTYAAIHGSFERSAPESHRRLLRLLGFSKADIREFLASLEKHA